MTELKLNFSCPICGKLLIDEIEYLRARYIPSRDWWMIEHIIKGNPEKQWCAEAGYRMGTKNIYGHDDN